jgi:hypothetical protein
LTDVSTTDRSGPVDDDDDDGNDDDNGNDNGDGDGDGKPLTPIGAAAARGTVCSEIVSTTAVMAGLGSSDEETSAVVLKEPAVTASCVNTPLTMIGGSDVPAATGYVPV